MIVLDTNILSELMRPSIDPIISDWLDRQPVTIVWTTSVTVFEIRNGLGLMPRGRRREALTDAFASVVADDLEGRIFPFDTAAAEAAALIAAQHHRAGRSVEIRDLQIAGIVVTRTATLVTRNVRHFEGVGLSLVDPWNVAKPR